MKVGIRYWISALVFGFVAGGVAQAADSPDQPKPASASRAVILKKLRALGATESAPARREGIKTGRLNCRMDRSDVKPYDSSAPRTGRGTGRSGGATTR